MRHSSTLTSKGQVTIPQEIRIRLGLREGDRVEFVASGDAIVIRPARAAGNPFLEFAGVLDTFPEGAPAINRWVAELRDEE
jgi:AbrB family looped-hinge helix DNA binding protein